MRLLLVATILFSMNSPRCFSGDVVPDNRKELLHESARVEIQELSHALGFLIGQHTSLQSIKSKYPSLLPYAMKAESGFQASFGDAEKKITNILKTLFKEHYPEFHGSMVAQLNSFLGIQELSYDDAAAFIDEVEGRTRGEMPSPAREIILHYQFEGHPAGEMMQNYKQAYSTKDHPKSKGLHLQFEYPLSWSSQEGKRPNIIQFFRSYNGKGRVLASVLVRDAAQELAGVLTPAEMRLLNTREGSKAMLAEIISEDGARDLATGMGMRDVREIRTKRITIDSWPGVIVEFIGKNSRIDVELTMYNRSYIAVYKSYMIFLQFMINKETFESDDVLQKAIQEYAPLFDLMANSLVIMNQY